MISLEFGGNIYYFGSNYALDQIGYEYGTNLIAAGIIEALAIGSISTCRPIYTSSSKKCPGKRLFSVSTAFSRSSGFSFSFQQ